jgi:predicted acetyltransferase
MKIRKAELTDASELALLNQQLIVDEQHRNSMTLAELQERMSEWLSGEYSAYLFVTGGETLGYALSRVEDESVYLRQFFVFDRFRRQGVGRAAFGLLREQQWGGVGALAILGGGCLYAGIQVLLEAK